ncbi:MAG: putative pyridine nucleotide-disulfide oxidoreductase [Rhodospirillales bacterium]|nr:putative pyridine nucleotide-disulfide oxidoreductase [Rhodospirillales bacterium]
MARIVLAGAGHAHLHIVKRAAEFYRRGIELLVIAPEAFWYSGLATGMLGGRYPPELDQVDVETLVRSGGGLAMRDRVRHIDVDRQRVDLESGASLVYDLLSLDLGSAPSEIPGTTDQVYGVKPISNLLRLHDEVRRLATIPDHAPARIVVAGGGPAGCEVAANLAALGELGQRPLEISILTSRNQLLAGLPTRAGAITEQRLIQGGINILYCAAVRSIQQNFAVTEDGRRMPFDVLVNATGLKPSPVVSTTGLPTDMDGGLLVDRFLRSVGDPRIFGGGDCVSFAARDLPKLGVYAVREAPVLLHNLLAAQEGRILKPYAPQRRALMILNLGDGTGLAIRGGWVLKSRACAWLKDWIDRAFVGRYQDLSRS